MIGSVAAPASVYRAGDRTSTINSRAVVLLVVDTASLFFHFLSSLYLFADNASVLEPCVSTLLVACGFSFLHALTPAC